MASTRDLAALGKRTQGLLTYDQLRLVGVTGAVLTRMVAGGELVRVRRGVYATAAFPALPRFLVTDAGPAPEYVVRVRAVLLSLGDSAVAVGRTAAVLRGWPLLVEPVQVELGIPHGRKPRVLQGVSVRQRRDDARERLTVLPGTEPLAVTPAVDVVVDGAVGLAFVAAVVLADSALRAGAVSLADLRTVRATGRGDLRYARVLAWCDPASGSVPETVLRVRMRLAGYVGFLTQRVIHDVRGGFVMRVDFCFELARIVIEVDGWRWHQDGDADRARDNVLASLGWRVLRFTAVEVLYKTDRVLDEIGSALRWAA